MLVKFRADLSDVQRIAGLVGVAVRNEMYRGSSGFRVR